MSTPSFFLDKSTTPTPHDLKLVLENTYPIWQEIENLVYEQYPDGQPKWNFPGKKYGWNFTIKDKRRALIYFIPQKSSFEVAFVFGQKATDMILENDFDPLIKKKLQEAKKYAEGRGIRIEIKDKTYLQDIKKLITVKLKY